MDAQRFKDFTTWMIKESKYKVDERDIKAAYKSDLLKIELAEGKLDKIFIEKGELKTLWNLYKYSSRDARRSRPNPTNMAIDHSQLLADLRTYRSRINQYRQFCEKYPPALIKAD